MGAGAGGTRVAAEGIGVWNPAFDVAPAANITGVRHARLQGHGLATCSALVVQACTHQHEHPAPQPLPSVCAPAHMYKRRDQLADEAPVLNDQRSQHPHA